MRFEGKNNYFKDLAHRVKCFKNIPKTLAVRHQRLVCYQLASGNSTFFKDTAIGPGTQEDSHICIYAWGLFCVSILVTSTTVSS